MPVAYFKCVCGEEHRDFVSFDHTHDVYNERTHRWDFDPSLKDIPVPVRTVKCAKCGGEVQESLDPKGVKPRFHFNWMADD